MKRIKAEFLTEKEANKAMGKISPYCGNAQVSLSYNVNAAPYDENYFYDYPETGAANFGGLGMTSGWNLFPRGIMGDIYGRPFSHSGNPSYNQSNYAVLETDVADGSFEYVKNKLYAFGAVSVI